LKRYKRTTVSLSPEILATAKKLMKAGKFNGFSGFIAQLIRDDWKRHRGELKITDEITDDVIRRIGGGGEKK